MIILRQLIAGFGEPESFDKFSAWLCSKDTDSRMEGPWHRWRWGFLHLLFPRGGKEW
jgi:hypothetical protein